jgi:hypothetical protein
MRHVCQYKDGLHAFFFTSPAAIKSTSRLPENPPASGQFFQFGGHCIRLFGLISQHFGLIGRSGAQVYVQMSIQRERAEAGVSLHEDTSELPTKSKRDRRPKHRLLTLEDLDRRTRSAQFACETRDAICADIGGADRLSTLQTILADNVAVMTAMLADLKVRWLKGDDVDVMAIATLTNTFNRSAAMLGIQRQARDVVPDLRTYLDTVQKPAGSDASGDDDDGEADDAQPENAAPDAPEADTEHIPSANLAEGAEPRAEPAQIGDVIEIEEGKALIQFTELLADKREKWWILRPDGFALEQFFSREAAEKRARVLVETKFL